MSAKLLSAILLDNISMVRVSCIIGRCIKIRGMEKDVKSKEYWEIPAINRDAQREAEIVWDSVCKPLGSLGEMERLVCQLAAIYGTTHIDISRRCVMVVCADNGVVEERISQTGSEVTAVVARQIAEGKSNINIMAEAAGADTLVADVGMLEPVTHPRLICERIASGTGNIAHGAAMSREQAVQAVETGIRLAHYVRKKGYSLLLTGEMGIGNTTTTSAVTAVLSGRPAGEVTGRGAGLSRKGWEHKVDVVQRALEVNRPDPSDALDVLAKLGGYDMAAMAGLFIGGAMERMPVVIDGVISSVSALLAERIAPHCRDYMIASHMTEEPAGVVIMDMLGLHPMIHAGLRLGEGTGGVCVLPLLDIALAEFRGAHRFAETEVEQYEHLN